MQLSRNSIYIIACGVLASTVAVLFIVKASYNTWGNDSEPKYNNDIPNNFTDNPKDNFTDNPRDNSTTGPPNNYKDIVLNNCRICNGKVGIYNYDDCDGVMPSIYFYDIVLISENYFIEHFTNKESGAYMQNALFAKRSFGR